MSNSLDPDKMAHYEPSNQDLRCLQKLIKIACSSERVKAHRVIKAVSFCGKGEEPNKSI